MPPKEEKKRDIIEERKKAYNAAAAEAQRAADAIDGAAEDADLSELSLNLATAKSEAERTRANLEAAEAAAKTREGFQPVELHDPAEIGLNEREVRQYSLLRAINASATGNWRGAELEKEASDEIAKRTGRAAQGFWVPTEIQRRDLNVTTDSAGGYTVQTTVQAQNFIELLRNKLLVQGLGATYLGGLVGDIAIPKQTAAGTAYWVAESGAPTESQQTVSQVAMSPKTIGAFTDISRKLLLQSSLDVENFVMNDLAKIVALGIDLAALHGTGTNNQPTGIDGQDDVNIVIATLASLTWANIVDLETAVAVDNADIGKMAYACNATTRGYLKQTPKIGTTYPVFLWADGDTPVNGYGCGVSNQVTGTMFFGNWEDLVIGQWSGLDVLVDPYTGGTSGTVRTIVLQDTDIAVRHGQSFAMTAESS